MSTATITWSVNNLERYVVTGLVYAVHYTVDARDEVYSEGAYGSVPLTPPEDYVPATPFDELTEEVVIGWVKEALGEEKVAEIEALLSERLSEKSAPTKAAGLPW